MAKTGALPFRTGSAFVIRELTGEQSTITLKGRGLPRRPFTLSGQMRTDLSWYAGSPEATLQVMGATLDDTTISGKWSDKFISMNTQEEEIIAAFSKGHISGQPQRFQNDRDDRSAPVTLTPGDTSGFFSFTNVSQLADAVDRIRRHGQIIEVTWGSQLRRGILKKFIQKWHTHQDMEWDMVFQWMSQDAASLSSLDVKTTGTFDLNTAVDKAFDDLEFISHKKYKAPKGAFRASFEGSLLDRVKASSIPTAIDEFGNKVNGGFRNIAETITDVQNAVFDLEDVAIQSSRAVIGFADSAKRVAGAWDFLKQRADELALLLENVEDAISLNVGEDVGERLTGRKITRDRRRSAREMVNDSARQQDTVLQQLNPQLLRVFTARAGTDLRDISTLHYGTPDAWQALLQYNKLSTSKLEAGQLIFVPRTPLKVEC